MPTWNGKETQVEKDARLSKERRKALLEAVDAFMEVITPTHPIGEHYHGEAPTLGEGRHETLPPQDRLDDS